MWCKHTNYEQSTRTPLIFSGGEWKGKSNSPTEFVDIYPTLCELAGIKTPENLDGESLVPLFENKVKKVKDFAVSQFPRENDKMGYTFRNERYRYTVWIKDEMPFESNRKFEANDVVAEEFYDYQADPLETKNLFLDESYQAEIEKLKTQAISFFNNQDSK